MVAILSAAQPYPGLRPFQAHDGPYFFGRENHIAALMRLVILHRFVAVVGASGSGKSSLVRAGLIPALEKRSDPNWGVFVIRPEATPFENLTEALSARFKGEAEAEIRTSRLSAILQSSSGGLLEAIQEMGHGSNKRILLVVDQFEELIRYDQNSIDTSVRFIRMLLRAASESGGRIHVLITMRLDFLADCSRFVGLIEAINEGQYLVPSLDRFQRRDAIVKPAEAAGKTVDQDLLQTLLNDADDAQDQLPVLQHGLMRICQVATDERNFSLAHYEKIGTLTFALSQHANEIYNGLPGEAARVVAEKAFRALTDIDRHGRGIRRQRKLGALAAELGFETNSGVPRLLQDVVDRFRREPACFLLPPENQQLSLDTIIDISHESLIRRWDRFGAQRQEGGWLFQEAREGRAFQTLINDLLAWQSS